MKYTLKNENIENYNESDSFSFPKYTSQLINWANQNAQGNALDVSPQALAVPDIDSYTGLMHTLFTLEDRYGLEVCEGDDEIHLRVNFRKGRDADQLHRMLTAWSEVAAKLKAGEITQEEYDRWRYRYPEFDTTQRWAKVPSQALSDMLIQALKEEGK